MHLRKCYLGSLLIVNLRSRILVTAEALGALGGTFPLSQEKVLETLRSLGLTKTDAQIYVFLGRKGPQKAMEISKSLKMPRQTLYLAIKNLKSKGIVTQTLEHPAKFSALPFEKVLDLFVKAKTDEVQRIEQERKSLLLDWQSIAIAEARDQSPRFTVIEGRNHIYPRLKQMIEDAKSQLSIVSTVSGLVRADQFGLIDAAFNHAFKTNTTIRFLTELSEENLKTMKLLLNKRPKAGTKFEGRTPELGLKLISRMLIRDDVEAAFFVSQDTDKTRESDDVCLWTNSISIVNSFKAVFEDLWHNSIDIERRITEIETGRPAKKTYVLSDSETAQKKYGEVIESAETEIAMMTSSQGLFEVWKNHSQLKEKAEKGVSVKIMAPITRDNLEAAQRLSEWCKVKHVPTSYLRTTIVDGNHLFQFKNPTFNGDSRDKALSFENTFYTNDSEYVKKIKTMLDDTWKNAPAPSTVTIEDKTKPPMPPVAPVPDDEYTGSRKDSPYKKSIIRSEEKIGTITEQEILKKMINARRTPFRNPLKDTAQFYGSDAAAIVHSPPSFNLPDMLLVFFHLNKKSTFGAEDCFQVHLWLETPKGHAYVPVAFVGDNPKGMEWRKSFLGDTPASKNALILKKDELQIQVHGNTIFAGWTVPIPLFPPQYVLPPASLLFEGYGKLKTIVTTSVFPSGARVITEGNGFDAFVTFFHPESKYAGPGTDGIMGRDIIMTTYPPATE